MARPSKYATSKDRQEAIRAQTRARVARWIAKHPRRWKRIARRSRAKADTKIIIPLEFAND